MQVMAGKLSNLKFKNVVFYNSSDDDEDTEIDLGLSLEKLNIGPRKKLLVLGLGGLLVRRIHRYKDVGNRNRRADAVCGNFLVFRRPFCKEFMEFCFERFEVGIWSSAKEWNINGVLNTIMSGLYGRLLFVWDQEECTDSGFMCLENKEKPVFLKEQKKLWDKKGPALPWRSGQYSSSNTLFIDDKPHKALLNPPNTAIFPHTYHFDNVNDTVLGPKGELQQYLKGVADADDVPSYVKEHPFGQPAITPAHSDWKFYSKIIGELQKGEDAEKKIMNTISKLLIP